MSFFGKRCGSVTWYVVFQKSHYRRPWHIFTRNGYEHISLLKNHHPSSPGFDSLDGVLKIEVLSTYIDTDWEPADIKLLTEKLSESAYVKDIIKIVLPVPDTENWRFGGIINCVTIVKFAMGIDKFWIWTPLQLKNYLLKIGGQKLHGYSISTIVG